MEYYRVKSQPFSGTNYTELYRKARLFFKRIHLNPRRKLFIKSAYFHKQKIFFDHFWEHLLQKSIKQRKQRLKYLPCMKELLENSLTNPRVTIQSNSEKYYRFLGQVTNGAYFAVQIKEKNHKLQCISIFPWKKKNLRLLWYINHSPRF